MKNSSHIKTAGSIKYNHIPDEVIEEIHSLDPVSVYSQYGVQLSINGSGWTALCPFHSEKTASFKVSATTGRFKCFGCDKSGDLVAFVMDHEHLDFPGAILDIALKNNITVENNQVTGKEEEDYKEKESLFEVNRCAKDFFALQLQKNTKALEYVRCRWNDAIISDFSLGYAPAGWIFFHQAATKAGYQDDILIKSALIVKAPKTGKLIDFFRDRIMFPIHDKHGRITGFTGRDLSDKTENPKYLNSKETPIFKKGKEFYGYHLSRKAIKDQNNIYLVEGNADVLKLHQLGITNTIGVNGTSLSDDQVQFLKKCNTRLTLIPDADPAGEKALDRWAEKIISAGLICHFISLPGENGKQDPDSFFKDSAQFKEFESKQSKDFILHKASQQKSSYEAPDKKAILRESLIKLVSCLPKNRHSDYYDELANILPPRKAWSDQAKELQKGPEIKGNPDSPEKKADNPDKPKIKGDHDFYFIEKDKDLQFRDIRIDRVKLINKLKELGFYRFDIDANNNRFVRIINNTITEVSSTLITDQFITYIDELEAYQHKWEGGSKLIDNTIIKRKIYNGLDTYFSGTLLKRLSPIHPGMIKKDTREEKYLFYKNGFVIVSKNEYKFQEYNKMGQYCYIWSNQILQREFKLDSMSETQPSVFEKFIKNICGQDLLRIESMKTIIGYTLHNFMDCKLYAVILTDSKISQDGEANGRTGKTLWGKGLGNILNTNDQSSVYIEVNGKDFKVSDKFKFQKANLDSQLIHINDIYNNYNIEHSFNDITEGIEVDKKNEKPFRIKPKFIFSSNKTIIIEGESAKDRVIQFEFSDYYNSDFNPKIEFGHWFFTEWDPSEWARFDHYMISCILTYFQMGLKRPPEINLSYRTLQDHTSIDFINFMDDAFNQDPENIPEYESDKLIIVPNVIVLKKRLFTFFIKLHEDFNNQKFKQREFTKWVRRYCAFKKIKIVEEGRSNGNDFFKFDFLPF